MLVSLEQGLEGALGKPWLERKMQRSLLCRGRERNADLMVSILLGLLSIYNERSRSNTQLNQQTRRIMPVQLLVSLLSISTAG